MFPARVYTVLRTDSRYPMYCARIRLLSLARPGVSENVNDTLARHLLEQLYTPVSSDYLLLRFLAVVTAGNFARAETHLEDNTLGLSSCLSAKHLPGEARTVTGDCLSRVTPPLQPGTVTNRRVTSRGKAYTFLQAHAQRRVTLRRNVIKL